MLREGFVAVVVVVSWKLSPAKSPMRLLLLLLLLLFMGLLGGLLSAKMPTRSSARLGGCGVESVKSSRTLDMVLFCLMLLAVAVLPAAARVGGGGGGVDGRSEVNVQ